MPVGVSTRDGELPLQKVDGDDDAMVGGMLTHHVL